MKKLFLVLAILALATMACNFSASIDLGSDQPIQRLSPAEKARADEASQGFYLLLGFSILILVSGLYAIVVKVPQLDHPTRFVYLSVYTILLVGGILAMLLGALVWGSWPLLIGGLVAIGLSIPWGFWGHKLFR